MHTLHIIGSLDGGGAETQLRILLNSLASRGNSVTVICLDDDAKNRLLDSVNVIQIDRSNGLIHLSFKIIRSVFKVNPDIIQLWLPDIVTMPASIGAWLSRTPMVACLRRKPAPISDPVLFLRDRAEYLTYALSDVVVSNFSFSLIESLPLKLILSYSDKNVIPNAVTTSLNPSVSDITDKDKIHLVYAGRLVDHKNVSLIPEVVDILTQRSVNIEAHLFGDGKKKEYCINKCKSLGTYKKVRFYGYDSSWLDKARDMDIFIFPSRMEGMPNALLEASSIGLPIVTSRIPEIESIYTNKHDALLSNIKPEPFAENILRLLNNDDLYKKIAKNGLKLSSQYSRENMVMGYLKSYRKMLAR